MIKGFGKKEFTCYLERCHAELKSYPREIEKTNNLRKQRN